MRIILSPVAGWKTLSVSVKGLVITVDGVDYDLSIIPENGQADAQEPSPFVSPVRREAVTIRYEYDSTKALPEQSPDVNDYIFEIEEGVVPCPIKWKEQE